MKDNFLKIDDRLQASNGRRCGMSIRSAMEEAAMYVDLFTCCNGNKLSKIYPHIGTSYKGSSTKKGNNPKAIKARRKKNKNKKTYRK